jgi:hypothetical protein
LQNPVMEGIITILIVAVRFNTSFSCPCNYICHTLLLVVANPAITFHDDKELRINKFLFRIYLLDFRSIWMYHERQKTWTWNFKTWNLRGKTNDTGDLIFHTFQTLWQNRELCMHQNIGLLRERTWASLLSQKKPFGNPPQ